MRLSFHVGSAAICGFVVLRSSPVLQSTLTRLHCPGPRLRFSYSAGPVVGAPFTSAPFPRSSSLALAVSSPAAGQTLALPIPIVWDVLSGTAHLFSVYYKPSNSTVWQSVAGCLRVPGTERTCWSASPSYNDSATVFRVVAFDSDGLHQSADSAPCSVQKVPTLSIALPTSTSLVVVGIPFSISWQSTTLFVTQVLRVPIRPLV